MAERKTKSRCMALRNGRSTKYLGSVENTQLLKRQNQLEYPEHYNENSNEYISLNVAALSGLDFICFSSILTNMAADDLVKLFFSHPRFEVDAVRAYKAIWKKGETTTLTLLLSSKPEHAERMNRNRRALEIFGVYATAVKIVGYRDQQANAEDLEFMMNVIQRCPSVRTVTLELIVIPRALNYSQLFPHVPSVDLLFSYIDLDLQLINLTEFTANISPSDNCESCSKFNNNLSRSEFKRFFELNPQLQIVNLYAINSDVCMTKYVPCRINTFLYQLIFRDFGTRMQMVSFKIYARDNRLSQVNMENGKFEEIVTNV